MGGDRGFLHDPQRFVVVIRRVGRGRRRDRRSARSAGRYGPADPVRADEEPARPARTAPATISGSGAVPTARTMAPARGDGALFLAYELTLASLSRKVA